MNQWVWSSDMEYLAKGTFSESSGSYIVQLELGKDG